MLQIYDPIVQEKANYRESACENSEEYGQKFGSVLRLPTLQDRITLRIGRLLIALGQKMTVASTEKMELSKEMS